MSHVRIHGDPFGDDNAARHLRAFLGLAQSSGMRCALSLSAVRMRAPGPGDQVVELTDGVRDLRTATAFVKPLLGRDEAVGPAEFVRARALRAVLRDLGRRNTRGAGADQDLRAAFSSVAGDAEVRFELDDEGVVRLVPAATGVDGALAEIIARVHAAQASGAWRRLKSCPGPHCGWLFYDGSRNASSRWCSMSICGNRTKTAAYRRRRTA